MQIVIVVGTRPDIIKMNPVIAQLGEACTVVSTLQHVDKNMHDEFFAANGLPNHLWDTIPRKLSSKDLPISATYADIFNGMTQHLQNAYVDAPLVVVYGDTLSALAAASAAKALRCDVAHVEAGLRSGNLGMPEEVARIAIDAMADHLFAPTTGAVRNLEKEMVDGDIYMSGNTIQDVLTAYGDGPPTTPTNHYALLTLHRRENDRYLDAMHMDIFKATQAVGLNLKIIKHPRTKVQPFFGVCAPVDFLEPQPHSNMVQLVRGATVVLTDSGGLQEECSILGIPCITLRDTTERPETVDSGWNMLYHPLLDTPRHRNKLDLPAVIMHMLVTTRNKPRYAYAPERGGTPAEYIAQTLREVSGYR